MEKTKEIQKNETDDLKKSIIAEGFKKEVKIALGSKADCDRYIRGVLTTIALSQDLQKCSKMSILKSILDAAQLGLDVDSKGHAYLVPYKNSCQLIPGYKGYIAKARASKQITRITVEAVYKGDQFSVTKGTEPSINHIPDVYNKDKEITHFYAVVKNVYNEIEFEVMTMEQVMQFAGKREGNLNYIWQNNLQEMGKKVVLKRLLKKLQLPEIENIQIYDNAIDEGNSPSMEKGSVKIEKNTVDPKEFEKETNRIIKEARKKLKYTVPQVFEFAYGLFGLEWEKLAPDQKRHVAWALEEEANGSK